MTCPFREITHHKNEAESIINSCVEKSCRLWSPQAEECLFVMMCASTVDVNALVLMRNADGRIIKPR